MQQSSFKYNKLAQNTSQTEMLHIYKRTCLQTKPLQTRVQANTRARARSVTCMHILIHTYTQIDANRQIHTYTHASARAHTSRHTWAHAQKWRSTNK